MSHSDAPSQNTTEVVIVGAGPYGLSVAAHLAATGVPFRIFGKPMSAWSDQMPKGMLLKSEGFASTLSDPGSHFTLSGFCRQQGLPYEDNQRPVELETFVAYGLAFQKKLVPNLEDNLVVSIRRSPHGFEVGLNDGGSVWARKVVIAAGIAHFAYVPEVLSGLPAEFVTHSSMHSDLDGFKGRRVAVVGAGASALDLAALLHNAGALVHVIARGPAIRFFDPPQPRSLREKILSPGTGLGTGYDFLFYSKAPHVFRLLPEKLRLNRVQRTLGPRPGWFVRDQVVGKVSIQLNQSITGASIGNDCVHLRLKGPEGTGSLEVDHVIAATGYRVDLGRLEMLSSELRSEIRLTGKSPLLSSNFESSVPGLYFAGVVAANTFGPVMRFVYGAPFAARRLSRHLAKVARKSAKVLTRPDVREIFE